MQTCAGDWKAVNDYRASVTWTGIIGADGTVVALPVSDRPALSDPIFDANARLIAAAPEMVETLQALDAFWSEGGYNPDDVIWTDGMRAIWKRLRAAIAKATGAA